MEDEKTYQEIKENFLNKYKNEFLPKLESIKINYEKGENGKSNIYTKIKKIFDINGPYFIIISAVVILCLYSLLPLLKNAAMGFLLLFIFPIQLAVTILVLIPPERLAEKRLKKLIMPELCKCLPDFMWFPNSENIKTHAKSGLPIKRCICDDSFMGQYKGVYFRIEELFIPYFNLNFKRMAKKIPYLLIQFRLNKCFKGHTVIYPDTKDKISPVYNLRYTEMEDIIFEENFDVFTNDEVEARYVITPVFMDKLKDVEYKYQSSCKDIYVSFQKENFYILLKAKSNLFEINSIYENPNEYNERLWFDQIISIMKLIDYFQLDKNIGM